VKKDERGMQRVWGRVVYRVVVGKPERERPLGRLRRRWQDNIEMDLQEVRLGGGDMDWIDLAQERDRWRALVNTVKNLQVSQNAGNFSTSCETVSFSRRALLQGLSNISNFILTAFVLEPYNFLSIESSYIYFNLFPQSKRHMTHPPQQTTRMSSFQ
jgi:hypothetical protein